MQDVTKSQHLNLVLQKRQLGTKEAALQLQQQDMHQPGLMGF
jgi:hypothetical protein